MFNKMVKETVRQNNGDVRAANAEVISTIRNIRNKDEAFAILTRNNKLFNEEGIRFSAEQGEIKMNGMSVDILEFGSMTKTEKTRFLIDLPPPPEPYGGNANLTATQRTMTTIQTVFDMENLTTVAKYGRLISTSCSFAQFAQTLLEDFSAIIQEKVLRICRALVDNLLGSMNFSKVSSDYFSYISREPCAVALRFVIDFLKGKINNYEAQYEEEKEMAKYLPGYDEDEFNKKWGVCPETGKRALIWFERSVNIFVLGSSIDQLLLRELVQYAMNIITEKVYEHCDAEEKRQRREANTTRFAHKVECNICGGYYYSKIQPS